MKKKNLGFTLAEVLIVIGIIGVVAALTLPNLNHSTGDKETVTRLQKAYSILSEANDRAVAIYGPISTWSEECRNDLQTCWTNRISEFLKISKSCNENVDSDSDQYAICDSLEGDSGANEGVMFQFADGITVAPKCYSSLCDASEGAGGLSDVCFDDIEIDINGPKGKNLGGYDIFRFVVSDSLGFIPYDFSDLGQDRIEWVADFCAGPANECTLWVLEFGNLDYTKLDSSRKCIDNPSIVLDGVHNTSCH